MLRLPKTLDLTRSCPLVLINTPIVDVNWERFADKNHIALISITTPSVELVRIFITDACRSLPVDSSRIFFVGDELVPLLPLFTDQVAAATEKSEPEAAWKDLKPGSMSGVAESTLTVSVTGLRNAKGIMAAQLFSDEESFKKHETTYNALSEISEKKSATLKFSKLAKGTYALMVLHDENKNGKMDTGLFGIPKEGFAMSRDPKVKLGPPRWKECCFLITNASAERELIVKAQYL